MRRLSTNGERIAVFIDTVDEDRLWVDFCPEPRKPPINFVLHLAGNLDQHVLWWLGRSPCVCDWERQFTEKLPKNREALSAMLLEILGQCIAVIGGLGEENPERMYPCSSWACRLFLHVDLQFRSDVAFDFPVHLVVFLTMNAL